MTEDPSEQHIRAWVRLVKAGQQVLASVEAELKTAGCPPLSWYDVLLELRRSEGGQLRPLEIESRLLMAQHNVSRLVDRLERAGHVRREPYAADGRGQVIAITDSGRALLAAMWPVYRAAIERHVGQRLTAAEAEQLAGLLGRLIGVGG